MKRFLILIFVCMFNCGCLFTPRKDTSRFYALGLNKSCCNQKCLPAGNECKVICLNIESIPAYSDMSQIVKLRSGCEVVQSETHRWAEPVKHSIARSLLNHLDGAFGGKYILVPLFESNASRICEYKVHVGFTNFIFSEDRSELLLSANVSIFKKDKLVTVCEYSNRFTVGSGRYKSVVEGMDRALNSLGEFIARCIDGKCVKNAATKASKRPISDEMAVDNSTDNCCSDAAECDAKNTQSLGEAEEFPKIINISSRGEVYIVVDSEDGKHRYFSGRLFNGSSVDVKCDSPYKVISTDGDLIDVK